MKATIVILAALSLASSAGKCRKNTSGGDASNLVELKTSGCFGFCPMFRLTALNNGLVRYEGERFVEKVGKDSFQLTPAELKQLKTKVKDANLWQYPDKIKTDIVDAPFATLIAYEGGRSKTVTGSVDRPAPLLELEALLKDLAEAHGVQVKRGVNPNDPPAKAPKELIVKLKPDVNAGNWVAQFQEIKVRLVRRLGSENIWLVSYDSSQVGEKDMIEVLKSTQGVLEVQANGQVKDRN